MSRLTEDLRKIVRFVTRDKYYLRHYDCTVVSQSPGPDTVDVIPDDPVVRGSGLQGIPIYNGLPGAKVRVLPGSSAVLFYANGDPQKPRVMLTDPASIEIQLQDGLMPVARVGDTVSVTVADPISGTLTGTGVIIAGAPLVKA